MIAHGDPVCCGVGEMSSELGAVRCTRVFGEVTVGCCACGRRRVGERVSSLAEVALLIWGRCRCFNGVEEVQVVDVDSCRQNSPVKPRDWLAHVLRQADPGLVATYLVNVCSRLHHRLV